MPLANAQRSAKTKARAPHSSPHSTVEGGNAMYSPTTPPTNAPQLNRATAGIAGFTLFPKRGNTPKGGTGVGLSGRSSNLRAVVEHARGQLDRSVPVLSRKLERNLWMTESEPNLVEDWGEAPVLERVIRHQQTDARFLCVVEQVAVLRKSELSFFRLQHGPA